MKGFKFITTPTYLYIDPKEQKIRQYWLDSTVFNLVLCPILGCILGGMLSEEKIDYWIGLGALIAIAGAGALRAFVLYQFGYKGQGNKLLKLNMLVGVFCTLFELDQLDSNLDLIKLFVILDSIFFTVWFFLSYQLIQINKKIAVLKTWKLMPQEYENGLDQLKIALDLTDLESKFGALVRMWPQWKSTSKKRYKSRKKELLNL